MDTSTNTFSPTYRIWRIAPRRESIKGLNSSSVAVTFFACWESEKSNSAFVASFAVKISQTLTLSGCRAEATERTSSVTVASWVEYKKENDRLKKAKRNFLDFKCINASPQSRSISSRSRFQTPSVQFGEEDDSGRGGGINRHQLSIQSTSVVGGEIGRVAAWTIPSSLLYTGHQEQKDEQENKAKTIIEQWTKENKFNL